VLITKFEACGVVGVLFFSAPRRRGSRCRRAASAVDVATVWCGASAGVEGAMSASRLGFEGRIDKALCRGEGVGPGVFGYAFKRLALLVTIWCWRAGSPRWGCGRRRLRPSSPVVHGLFVEVLSGALLRGVEWASSMDMGEGAASPAGSSTALCTPPPSKVSRRTSPYGSDGGLRE
jgi:hypothetical protein